MLFARRKTYVRRARSMSTEQNRHTCSRSVVLNEEGKRRHNARFSTPHDLALLRARRERPRGRRAAEQRDEVAPRLIRSPRRPRKRGHS